MKIISGTVIDRETTLTFEEVCQAIHADDQLVIQLIEYHIIQPKGTSKINWQFDDLALKRARLARNFYYDLEVNFAGIGLLIELLERIETLERDVEKNRVSSLGACAN
ncbi:MAG: chaperone modulator CbpM [Coxiellaceae bacterium]|nr:chaperone modulator CbpM [Coxiellaceae bacterium]